MARTKQMKGPPPDADTAEVLRNLDPAIVDGFKKIRAKEKQIDALIAKYVQDHKDELTALWRALKADTSIERKYLKPYYKLFEAWDETNDLEPEERADAQEKLRVGFRALSSGGMVDFLKTLGMDDGAADAVDPKQYEEEGRAAGSTGKGQDDCPYAPGTVAYGVWTTGWRKAQEKIAKEMGPKGGNGTATTAAH